MGYFGRATLTGPGHEAASLPNQDYADYCEFGDGFALVLADGAGSKPQSDRGAWMASSAAFRSLQSSLRKIEEGGENPGVAAMVETAMEAAIAFVKQDPEAHELGCTLILAFAQGEELALATLGDSLGVVELASGELELLFNGRVSEFANETELVTNSNPSIRVESYDRAEVTAVALVSDGFEDFAFSQGLIFEPFWRRVFEWASGGELDLQAMLEHVQTSGKLSDDTTIVLYAKTTV